MSSKHACTGRPCPGPRQGPYDHRHLFVPVLESGRPRSRCGQGWFLTRHLSWARGRCALPVALPGRPPVCVCPSVLISQSFGIGAALVTPFYADISSAQTRLHTQPRSEVLGRGPQGTPFGPRRRPFLRRRVCADTVCTSPASARHFPLEPRGHRHRLPELESMTEQKLPSRAGSGVNSFTRDS